MTVSVQKVSQALSENHQRGIRMTGTPGYQVEKDPNTGVVFISYYQPVSMGQVGAEVLEPYLSDLENANLDFTFDRETGLIKVTGRKNTPIPGTGRGRGMTPEGRQAVSEKLSAYWQTHEHPLKGKHMTEEAKEAIRVKWNARKVLAQLAMQLYKQALDEKILTLPELEGVTAEELKLMVENVASGYTDQVRSERNQTATSTSTNGAHPVETELEQGTLLVEDEGDNNGTTILLQSAAPSTTVLREGEGNHTTIIEFDSVESDSHADIEEDEEFEDTSDLDELSDEYPEEDDDEFEDDDSDSDTE
jgi:hypothetical protein